MHLLSLTFTGLGSQYTRWCRVKHSLRRVQTPPGPVLEVVISKFWPNVFFFFFFQCRLYIKWNKLTARYSYLRGNLCVAFSPLASISAKSLVFLFCFWGSVEIALPGLSWPDFSLCSSFGSRPPMFERNFVAPLVFSQNYCHVRYCHVRCSLRRIVMFRSGLARNLAL